MPTGREGSSIRQIKQPPKALPSLAAILNPVSLTLKHVMSVLMWKGPRLNAAVDPGLAPVALTRLTRIEEVRGHFMVDV